MPCRGRTPRLGLSFLIKSHKFSLLFREMNELFHVDSRSDPTGYPGRYKFELGRTLHGVEKIEVVHGEVPSSIFSFDDGPTEVDLSRGHYGDGMTSLNTMVFHVADSPSRYEVYSRIPAVAQ